MNKRTFRCLLFNLLLAALIGACGQLEESAVELPEAAEIRQAVRQQLQERTGVDPEQIEILEVEQREWSDACLELPEPDEACAQTITPGWLLRARVEGQEIEVHTNADASQIRIAGMATGVLLPRIAGVPMTQGNDQGQR